MEVTGNMLDYIAHMSSIQAQYFNREGRGGKKRYHDAMRRPGGELRGCAPTDTGAPWRRTPHLSRVLTCRRRQLYTEAMRGPGGGVPGVRSRRHWGKNTV